MHVVQKFVFKKISFIGIQCSHSIPVFTCISLIHCMDLCILGLEEGITNMEEIVLKANTRKMGIDWRLAYNELKRLTIMMKREARERGK